tara:strand:- start:183 stop:353 length:171 start_codon:yes stop_codon:yes gene_type:complete
MCVFDFLNLEEYLPNFVNEGYEELEDLEDADDETLKEINITKMGHRMKILKYLGRH